MVSLARRLNKDFGYENELNVMILDEYNAARHPMRNSTSYCEAERGLYHLNREMIGRSTLNFLRYEASLTMKL
jgi:hypothetical protein